MGDGGKDVGGGEVWGMEERMRRGVRGEYKDCSCTVVSEPDPHIWIVCGVCGFGTRPSHMDSVGVWFRNQTLTYG